MVCKGLWSVGISVPFVFWSLLTLEIVPQPAFADLSASVIYGDDHRHDVYDEQDSTWIFSASSTVALINKSKVSVDQATDRASIDSKNFGQSWNLCSDEPFASQPTAAFCSGSLVGDDLVMTAGHCVTSQSGCQQTAFVFGFSLPTADHDPTSVPAQDVFYCKDLLVSRIENDGADFAVIKLDRPVLNHQPLALNRSGQISQDTPLTVIGHPSGLPTKIAGGAKVRDASPSGYIVANLDTYGGNSGSAVFNSQTGNVEGILVRGARDFVWQNGCYRSNICSDDGCSGEDVTRVSEVLSWIPGSR